MATYNGGRWLEGQLQSIAGQTRKPDELVIHDDGSNDDTPNIVAKFSEEASFLVKWAVNPQRLGPAQNFAGVVAACTCDIIALADQDDVWRADKLETLCGALSDEPGIGLVFSDMRLVDESSKPVGNTQWDALGFDGRLREAYAMGGGLDVLLKFNVVNGAALAFRASMLEHILPIPGGWMHDEWIALVCAAMAGTRLIDDTLVDYRVHGEQQVGPAVSGIRRQIAYARRHMNRAYFVTMLQRTQAMHQRLASRDVELVRPDAVALLAERVEHYRKRAELKSPGVLSLPTIVSELARGRYRRFGYGWKGVMQDLFLR